MATAVLYEEDISLPADQSDRTGDLPEVDVATSALSPTATTKPSPAPPALSGFIQTWAEQRPMLAKQVHDTGIEVAQHTGTKEFDAYVEGGEGQALMHDLTTVAFYGVQRSLADHWGLIFTGRMPAAMMKDFLALLRVEIAIPVIENARALDPLQALVIRSNSTKTTHVRTTYSRFKAQDARFEVSRPVLFLYWKDDLWSLIIPGQNTYQQFGGFQYTDTNGKVWNSGEVISKVFLTNLRRPSVVEKFTQLDQAFDRLRAHGKVVNLHRRLEKQLALLDRKIAAWSKVFASRKADQRATATGQYVRGAGQGRSARTAPDRAAGYRQDAGRSQPGRVDAMQLPAALDRRPQAAATWSQRAACARGMESGAEQPAGGDLPRRVRRHPRPPRRGGDRCHLRRHRAGLSGRVGRHRTERPRLGDRRHQSPRHARRCDPVALRLGDGDRPARSGGTRTHLPAGDGVRLPRSRDSGRDGFAHPRDERTRPAASGQPGAHTCLSERSCHESTISRRSSRAARRTIRK